MYYYGTFYIEVFQQWTCRLHCTKKKNFPLSISSVNVTKSAENCNTAYFNTALKASDQKEPELFFPSNWKIKLSY